MGAIRRNRVEQTPTTGIVRKSKLDGIGIFHALARYGTLPSYYLEGLDPRSGARSRLSRYHHETRDWLKKDLPIVRIQNWRQHGFNSQALYQPGLALTQHLRDDAIFDEEQLSWLSTTRIAPQATDHDIFLGCAVADIEIAATNAGLKFHHHLDLLKHAKKLEKKPMQFRVGDISFKGKHLKDALLEPDAYFALEYPEGIRHFFVEYDMGTESALSKHLDHPSWLRKVLTYQAAARTHVLDLPKFYVLAMYPKNRPHGAIEKAIREVYPNGSDLFCLMPHPELRPTQLLPKPTDYYFKGEWERPGKTPITLQKVR